MAPSHHASLSLSSVSNLPSAICHLPSAICHLPSAICHLPSAICHLPSAICHLPSAICHLPSAICHLPSAICHLPSAYFWIERINPVNSYWSANPANVLVKRPSIGSPKTNLSPCLSSSAMK